MGGAWLPAEAEVAAADEAEGVIRCLVAAQLHWQPPCFVVVLSLILPIAPGSPVQIFDQSPAWRGVSLVSRPAPPPTLLEWDFGCQERGSQQDTRPGERCQNRGYLLSHREQLPCGGSQWRTSG